MSDEVRNEPERSMPDRPFYSPFQSGVGLAAVILSALCIPLAVCIGTQSLTLSLPISPIWYFLPMVIAGIALGIYSSATPTGVAGAILGVAALFICVGFVAIERLHGPEIRAQMRPNPPSLPSGVTPQQLLNALRSPTTRP